MNVITPPHPNEQKSNKSARPSTKRVPTTSLYPRSAQVDQVMFVNLGVKENPRLVST